MVVPAKRTGLLLHTIPVFLAYFFQIPLAIFPNLFYDPIVFVRVFGNVSTLPTIEGHANTPLFFLSMSHNSGVT